MTQPAKHTPGPWSAYYNNEGLTITNASNVTIAYVDYDECEERPVAANAALIVAAPAMYEAIRKVIEHRAKDYLDNTIEPYCSLVAALAQADGKQ